MPTRSEGFGLVTAEAMMCKKPVLAANNSSLKEIINSGQDGILAETNNTSEWVKKMDTLIRNNTLRNKLAQAGFIKAKNMFIWEKAAVEHEKIYKNLING